MQPPVALVTQRNAPALLQQPGAWHRRASLRSVSQATAAILTLWLLLPESGLEEELMASRKTRRPPGAGHLFSRTTQSGSGVWYGKWYANGRQIKRKIGPKRDPNGAGLD